MRPGCRVRRSRGPETETAATTLPEGERTGADTEPTPGSRSPTLWAQPRRRTADSSAAENVAFYTHRGFAVVGEERVVEGKIRVWLMARAPRR